MLNKKGQALIEVLVGLTIVGILVGTATVAVIVSLRSNLQNKNFQAASSLSQKMLDDIKTVAEGNWQNIYSLTKGSGNQYYIAASGTALAVFSGATTTIVGNFTYTQFFSVENVNRDANGNIAESGINDPSTQKIVSHSQWPNAGQTSEVALSVYLTRWRNLVSRQTGWSGGSGQDGPISEFNQKFSTSSNINFSSSTDSIKIQGF
jgi:type II secretory pathway pseudopilin PulG